MTDTEVPARSESEAAYPRAVFVDIDGTLCDSRQRIPESALEALDQVRARGHRLFACTGRSTPEVYPRFWEVGFEGLVGGAGGYASVGNSVLIDERMPREHVDALTALWEELDAFYIWQGPDQMGPSDGYLDFFVPARASIPRTGSNTLGRSLPSSWTSTAGAFTKVTAYVPPEKASMERVNAALPDGYRAIIGSVGAAGYVPFEVVPGPSVESSRHPRHLPARGHSALLHRRARRLQQRRRGRGNGSGRHQHRDDCEALVDVADIVAPSVSEDGLAWALRAAGLTTLEHTGGHGLGDAR